MTTPRDLATYPSIASSPESQVKTVGLLVKSVKKSRGDG
jgi:hypothetical protein